MAFSAAAERESELRVYSVGFNGTRNELGVWKAAATPALAVTGSVSTWPGGATEQPLGDHQVSCRTETSIRTETADPMQQLTPLVDRPVASAAIP